jgi:hypothetical protein
VEVGPNSHSLNIIFLKLTWAFYSSVFTINRTQGLVERQAFNHPSLTT